MIAPRITRSVPRNLRGPDPRKSPKHLQLVSMLPCCVTLNEPPNDYHHLLRVTGEGPKGMGRKHADRWVVPLDPRLHLATYGPDTAHGHGDDEAWFASKGIDARALARALWKATGDLGEMRRIVFAHHQHARLRLKGLAPQPQETEQR